MSHKGKVYASVQIQISSRCGCPSDAVGFMILLCRARGQSGPTKIDAEHGSTSAKN